MKSVFLFFVLLATACALSINDVKVSQATNVAPPAYGDRFTTPTPNSLWGFDASNRPVNVTIAPSLSLSGNVLSAAGAGTGTVTSVSAGSLAPIFTTSVATATTTPAITFTLSSQSANRVLAGPTTGTAAPTFRLLVAGDIPALPYQPTGTYVTAVTATAPVASSGGTTPVISMSAASASQNGYLTASDWSLFNGKQPSGAYLTGIIADSPLSGAGTSASHLQIAQAGTVSAGFLSSSDWNLFNSKQASGNYITALTGDVTANGPASAAASLSSTGVVAGSYTSANIVVDAKGRITAAANGSGGGGGGSVSSVGLSLPSIFTVSGSPVTVSGTLTGTLNNQNPNFFFAGPSSGVPATPTFRALSSNDLPASGVSAGSYTNANITVDAAGRVTVAANGSGGAGIPGGANGSLQYNNSGAFGGYTPGAGVVTWLQTPSFSNLNSALTGDQVAGLAANQTFSGDITFTGSNNFFSNTTYFDSIGIFTGINDTNNVRTIDPTTRMLYASDGVTATLDWQSKQLPVAWDLGTPSALVLTNASSLPSTALPNTAVTPGSYTLASITVDAKGRITAASNGSAGTGTVTSFSAGTLSPLFTTSVATATSTPALTFAMTNAAQNAIFAGPASGGTGAPTYRAMVPTDIPSTAVTPGSYTNTNLTVDAQGRITAASNGSSTSGVSSITGTANQVLANGTSGSSQTGAVTLTLPQDIGFLSSPSFADISLTGGATPITYDKSIIGIAGPFFRNSNLGTGSAMGIAVSNEDAGPLPINSAVTVQANGRGFTTSGIDIQDAGSVTSGSTLSGGLVIGTRASAPLILAANGAEGARIASDGSLVASAPIVHKVYTVSGLPSAATYPYAIVGVSDATNAAGTGLGTAPTGGGSVKRMVYSDGSSWLLL